MSVDADRVVALATSAHELWSLPVQILVALVLLYTQVPAATAQILGISMVVIRLAGGVQCLWGARQRGAHRQPDHRVTFGVMFGRVCLLGACRCRRRSWLVRILGLYRLY